MFKSNVKKIGGFVTILFLFALMSLPSFVYSAESATSKKTGAEGTGITYECAETINGNVVYGNCDFQDLMNAVKKVTNFAAIITLSLSVIVIAVAGYKYMISGDNAGERTKANEMLRKIALGIIFILAAWLIVTLITNTLLKDAIKFSP
ncbi:MAG: pilin [Candidatus Zambryskibacteria bacterium]|nr:pilin [Candidatus Zambryskibacteria bacterium]